MVSLVPRDTGIVGFEVQSVSPATAAKLHDAEARHREAMGRHLDAMSRHIAVVEQTNHPN